MLSPFDLLTSWTVHAHQSPQAPYSTVWYVNEMLDGRGGCKLVCQSQLNGELHTTPCGWPRPMTTHPGRVLSHQISSLTSFGLRPKMKMLVRSLNRPTHQWGRHGFDGDACGQEACRGAHTRDRVQNDNCQSTDGIRSLTSLGSRPRKLRPWASEGRRTAGCSFRLRLGRKAKISG